MNRRIIQVPNPHMYNDWKEWAEKLAKELNDEFAMKPRDEYFIKKAVSGGDVLVKKETPAVIWEGTENSGIKIRLIENAGFFYLEKWNGSEWIKYGKFEFGNGKYLYSPDNGTTWYNYANLDTSGIIPANQMGSGTANNTKFLRGDRTWAEVNALRTTVKARAYRSGSINAPTNWNKVQLNAKSYDPGNNFDSTTNYRFVAPISGYYLVQGAVYIQNGTAGAGNFAVGIYKNGSIHARIGLLYLDTSRIVQINGGDIIFLNTNDYIELCYYLAPNMTDATLNGNPYTTYLAVHLIST